MKLLLLLVIHILVVIIIVQAERFTFDQDENSLRKCIEDHISTDYDLKIAEAAKSIAGIAAQRLRNKSLDKKQFQNLLDKMYYRIIGKKSNFFDDNIVPKRLKMSIRVALENCVKGRNLPRFDNEPSELAEFLNFVLVDWPTVPREMIRTREGRSTLRTYAYSVGVRLKSALSYFSMDYETFRRQLRRIWMLRAQQYYDSRRSIPYLRHRFTTNENRVYTSRDLGDIFTIDDVSSFESRRSQNFSSRNLVVRLRNSIRTMTLCPEDDVYIEYSHYGVTSAESYLEVHLDRCYRIIFFVLELQSRGINTDVDDIYDGPIPTNVISILFQDMLWNDEAYRIYLATLQQYFEQFSIEELGGQPLSGTKEELITRLTLLVLEKTAFAATTTTTSTEPPIYVVGSKKGGTRTRECGKYFIPNKRLKTMLPEQTLQLGSIDKNINYYGHISYNGDLNQMIFIDKDRFVFPEIFFGLNFNRDLAGVNFSSFDQFT